ncbi:MAG: 1-deoxy-D-xylulose-5-phosphate reductoisomerase, partial [Clostridiaceae bacterium]|nr:1-deoxy-D-xylulose-5-phosphate reductoisomerase [Clostridiaceae bacterium]
MKALSILGSTGSIGTQTLEIVRNNKSEFKVEALAANSNIDLLEAQVREFRPKVTAIGDKSKYEELKQRVSGLTEITAGLEGVVNAATAESCDTVVSAIVG